MKQEKLIDCNSINSSESQRAARPVRERPTLNTVLVCAGGAGILGGSFGDAGLLIGAIIGGLFGYYYRKHSDAC